MLSVLLLFLGPTSVATGAPPTVRLTGSFDRASYLPKQVSRFVLRVHSPRAQRAQVSLEIFGRGRGAESLMRRELQEQSLKQGTTRIAFSLRPSAIRATDGIFPVELRVTAGGEEARLGSQLVVVDRQRHGPMLVSIVWNVTQRSTISPKGVYLNRKVPAMVRGGPRPGRLAMHVSKLLRHTSARASFNITPELLSETLGLTRGYRLREPGGVVRVGSDSPEAADVEAFLGRMVTLMRAERVEMVPAPHAYPHLGELAGRDWDDDIRQQLTYGQIVVEQALGAPSTPGLFAPGLRLPPSAAIAFRRAGGEYTIVTPFGNLDPWRAHGVPVNAESPIKVAQCDAAATKIVTRHGSPSAVSRKLVRHLAKVRLARGRLPTASVIVLPIQPGWEPSAALVEELYRALAATPWVRMITLGSAVKATYAGPGRARLPAPTVSSRFKAYFRHIAQARRVLATYADMARPENSTAARLARNLLISESALWLPDSTTRRTGLRFAGDVTRTVQSELGKISVAETQTVTLPARSGKVPLAVANGTRHPLRVTLHLGGSDVDFPEGTAVTLDLRPGDNYLTVPVVVRGRTTASVRAVLMGGDRVLGRSTVHVRTTYFNRMVFLAAVIVALVVLLLVVYRKAGSEPGR